MGGDFWVAKQRFGCCKFPRAMALSSVCHLLQSLFSALNEARQGHTGARSTES